MHANGARLSWAKFKRCERLRVPPPVYARYVDEWALWESLRLQRRARASVGSQLYGRALARRAYRAWRSIIGTRRAGSTLSGAELRDLQRYCERPLRQIAAFVAYKRSHKGFFRLLLASWQQWARAHREAHSHANESIVRR